MLIRRDSLQQALSEIEDGTMVGADSVVVARGWWDALSVREQDGYRQRATAAGVALRADHGLGAHFVEVSGGERGMASEQEI